MSRRTRLLVGALGLALALALGVLKLAERTGSWDGSWLGRSAPRPAAHELPEFSSQPRHVILIVADTLRADHVEKERTASTPNLDQLAARGRLYSNSYASYHQTTMSMAAMFTGRTPSLETGDRARRLGWDPRTWCGMARLASDGDSCVPEGLVTIAEELSAAGFRTVGIASNKLMFDPSGYSQGFETWLQVGDESEQWISWAGDRVNAAVRKALTEQDERNLFLYVHYMDAHDWIVREQPTTLEEMRASYRDSVELLDRFVGHLLTDLAERGILQEAAVVFVSDHGESLGEAHLLPSTKTHFGNPSFKPVLRVPLIIAPALDLGDQPLVRSKDIPRILRRLAGLDAPSPARTSRLEPDEQFISEQRFQTYRRGRFKSFAPRDSDEIYMVDIETDPRETRDVAARFPEIVEEHRARMESLTTSLASADVGEPAIPEEQLRRLRILGYIE